MTAPKKSKGPTGPAVQSSELCRARRDSTNSTRVVSIPHIPLVDLNTMLPAQFVEFNLIGLMLIVLFLPLDVLDYVLNE